MQNIGKGRKGQNMRIYKSLYHTWMKFAHILGWVNTRIILTIIYFVIITPLSLIFKLVGKDPMNRYFDNVGSYWIKRESREFRQDRYRRLF